LLRKHRQNLFRLGNKLRAIRLLVWFNPVEQMMSDATPLFQAWLSRTDIQPTIELH
jgi:hypothetical protein